MCLITVDISSFQTENTSHAGATLKRASMSLSTRIDTAPTISRVFARLNKSTTKHLPGTEFDDEAATGHRRAVRASDQAEASMNLYSVVDHWWITDRLLIGNMHFARNLQSLRELGASQCNCDRTNRFSLGITHVLNVADTMGCAACTLGQNAKGQYAKYNISYLGIGEMYS